jgi:hypothetical protein
LAGELSAEEWALLDRITFEKASHVAAGDKARQCGKFQKLHGAQHLAPLADNRKAVVNLSDVPLVEAAYSALGKGLSYAVAPAVLPTEDFLSCVEKAVGVLTEKAAEEFRQETVKILKASRKHKENLSGAKRKAIRTLRTNADLTVLPADKGKAAIVLNTSDCNRKISALLGAPYI